MTAVVAAGRSDGGIRLFDLRTAGRQVAELRGQRDELQKSCTAHAEWIVNIIGEFSGVLLCA